MDTSTGRHHTEVFGGWRSESGWLKPYGVLLFLLRQQGLQALTQQRLLMDSLTSKVRVRCSFTAGFWRYFLEPRATFALCPEVSRPPINYGKHFGLQIPRGSSSQGARHLIRHGEVKALNILWDLTLFRHPQPCALNRAIDRTPLVLSKSLPRPEAASISCGVSCRKCKLKSHLPSKFRARFVCYICTRIGTRTELTTMGALGWTTTAHYPGPTISSAPQCVQPPKKETPLVAIRVASFLVL